VRPEFVLEQSLEHIKEKWKDAEDADGKINILVGICICIYFHYIYGGGCFLRLNKFSSLLVYIYVCAHMCLYIYIYICNYLC
jgi:hypothetical protein